MATKLSISAMYDQIMEIVDKLRLSDKALEFLDDIEDRAHDDDLTDGQLDWFMDIWKQACDSRY